MAKAILCCADWPSHVHCSAVIYMAKIMVASDRYADTFAPFIFSLLKNNSNISVIQSILVAFSDLLVRHPNIIGQYTSCIFEQLTNEVDEVRVQTLSIISELASKNLIKV